MFSNSLHTYIYLLHIFLYLAKNLKEFRDLEKILYGMVMVTSAAVLCPPGEGYDSSRIYETLFTGSMPVVERSTGLDRSFYKLPVLMVDDFVVLTPFMIKQAYLEVLYHAEMGRWDYQRLTGQWWENLMMDTAVAKDTSVLMERHPMPIFPDGIPFSRPFVPFDCSKGCGPGTHRTPPINSCGVDIKTDFVKYYDDWKYNPRHGYPLRHVDESLREPEFADLASEFVRNMTKKSTKSFVSQNNFQTISMPKVSYFASMGFSPPSDPKIWKKAIDNANEGKLVLLGQVRKVVKSTKDLVNTYGNYGKLKQFMDVQLTKESGFDPLKKP